jgi:hypothetical protein
MALFVHTHYLEVEIGDAEIRRNYLRLQRRARMMRIKRRNWRGSGRREQKLSKLALQFLNAGETGGFFVDMRRLQSDVAVQ